MNRYQLYGKNVKDALYLMGLEKCLPLDKFSCFNPYDGDKILAKKQAKEDENSARLASAMLRMLEKHKAKNEGKLPESSEDLFGEFCKDVKIGGSQEINDKKEGDQLPFN
jgi:hypothetical protein